MTNLGTNAPTILTIVGCTRAKNSRRLSSFKVTLIEGLNLARAEAERLGVPFLGEVPLHMDIRERSDSGQPVVATVPDGPHAQAYRDIAARVRDGLQVASRPAPKIVIEA
jgi:nitrogenase subunit NifH